MLYADLARDEVRLRAALARLGVGRGDKVAVVSKNRPEWVVVMVAAHALGAVIVPMYEVQHVEDWRHILRDANAKVCFASTMAIDAKIRGMLGDLPALAHVDHVRPQRIERHLVRSPPRNRPRRRCPLRRPVAPGRRGVHLHVRDDGEAKGGEALPRGLRVRSAGDA
jgi:long-subunit acyl-CoA synthetase (AMP-forming)